MRHLTHKKARALLQKEADLPITGDEKEALDEHLVGCESCHSYAEELIALEEKLRRATLARWDGYPLNLELQSLTKPAKSKESYRVINPLFKGTFVKITFVTTLVVASLFVIMLLGKQTTSTLGTLLATPTRTPLAEYMDNVTNVTDDKISKDPCDPVQYIVQESDTLEKIAFQFGVSKERIIDQNQLIVEKFNPGTILLVPMCTVTPTRTAMLPNNTHTTTPTGFVNK